jgi:hypothetical protein
MKKFTFSQIRTSPTGESGEYRYTQNIVDISTGICITLASAPGASSSRVTCLSPGRRVPEWDDNQLELLSRVIGHPVSKRLNGQPDVIEAALASYLNEVTLAYRSSVVADEGRFSDSDIESRLTWGDYWEGCPPDWAVGN